MINSEKYTHQNKATTFYAKKVKISSSENEKGLCIYK